ncbi:hypothetical protein Nepgr_005843 [Nepenthes gracilis]|uniref:Uncharacterized protein n=1 Tax=Nepenthes gracilis TaxID=150966 RepID=A0AAD3XGS2_NEPGR|nr:hypothetical protein Nepgr_005843 [Nepenthes gracilis]
MLRPLSNERSNSFYKVQQAKEGRITAEQTEQQSELILYSPEEDVSELIVQQQRLALASMPFTFFFLSLNRASPLPSIPYRFHGVTWPWFYYKNLNSFVTSLNSVEAP